MKIKTTKLFRSDAVDVYLDWFGEEEIKNGFGIGSKSQMAWDSFLKAEFVPFLPFETGMLADSATLATTIGSGEIIYRTPYARRLYYNPQFKFSTAVNPKAGAFWDRRAANERKQNFWIPFYRDLILKEFGGN